MDKWDDSYRLLQEGEIVLETDEILSDSGEWIRPIGSVGQPAPDPSYTSHRQFRRPKASPIFPLWYSSEDNAIYDAENTWIADVEYDDRSQDEMNRIGELLVQRANDGYRPKAEPPEQLTHHENMLIKPQKVNTSKATPSLEDEAREYFSFISEFTKDEKCLEDEALPDDLVLWINPFGKGTARSIGTVGDFARQQRRDAVEEFIEKCESRLWKGAMTRTELQAVAKEMDLTTSATLSPDARDQDIQAVQPPSQELPVRSDDEAGEVYS